MMADRVQHSGSTQGKTILGVEGDPCTRLLLEMYAEGVGHTVRWYEQGEGWGEMPPRQSTALLLVDLVSFMELGEMERTTVMDQAFHTNLYTLHVSGDAPELPGFDGMVAARFTKPLRLEDFLQIAGATDAKVAHLTSDGNATDEPGGEGNSDDRSMFGFENRMAELGMGEDMAREMAASFITRGRTLAVKLRAALMQEDGSTLHRLAHEFKSMSGNLFFEALASNCSLLMERTPDETAGLPANGCDALVNEITVGYENITARLLQHFPGLEAELPVDE